MTNRRPTGASPLTGKIEAVVWAEVVISIRGMSAKSTALVMLALLASADQTPATRPARRPVTNQAASQPAKQDTTKGSVPVTRSSCEDEERRLAGYTKALAIFTAGLFGATLVLAVATVLLWNTTARTLDQLGREFEAEHRPWIPAQVELASGWTWKDGDATVALRFGLRNIGRSPATNVDVHTKIFPNGWGFPSPAEAQKQLSQSVRGDIIKPGEGMGQTIFPGEAIRYRFIVMSIGAADFERSREAFKKQFPEANRTSFTPIVVGCITYRFLGKPHQTGFILELSGSDPMNPFTVLTLDAAQGDIGITQLRLADYWVASAVID